MQVDMGTGAAWHVQVAGAGTKRWWAELEMVLAVAGGADQWLVHVAECCNSSIGPRGRAPAGRPCECPVQSEGRAGDR